MNLTPEQQAKDEVQMRILERALQPNWQEFQQQANSYGLHFGPSFYAGMAQNNQDAGHFLKAARLWKMAAGVTLGHSRSAMYNEAADKCRDLAGAN